MGATKEHQKRTKGPRRDMVVVEEERREGGGEGGEKESRGGRLRGTRKAVADRISKSSQMR